MKILLVIKQNSDPLVVSAYLAERFGKGGVEVDVLAVVDDGNPVAMDDSGKQGQVVYHPRFQGKRQQSVEAVLAAVAKELKGRHGLPAVRTHVQHGDAVTSISAAADSLGSSLVLIEAPRRNRTLWGGRQDGVARQLLSRLPCPVELLRPYAATPRSLFNVLVPISVNSLNDLPMEQLKRLTWGPESCLHILCVQPRAITESRLEASAAAMVSSILQSRMEGVRARMKLQTACEQLRDSLGGAVEVKYEVVEGDMHEATIDGARRTYASLIVMSQPARQGMLNYLLSPMASTETVLAAPCSVLLLPVPRKQAVGSEVHQAGYIATQPQS